MGYSERSMQVFVDDRAITADSCQQILERCGASPSAKLLSYGRIISDLTLEENMCLNVFEPLDGGKKKKKKKYTTPKRIPGKKKKVKLHVLRFYKVDSSGRVMRTKRMCPSAMCGPGTFLAAHHDRTYCGRCATTFVVGEEEN